MTGLVLLLNGRRNMDRFFLLWLRPGMYARTGEKCPCRAEMLVPAISLALKWVSCKENAFFEDYAKFSSSRKLLLFVLCSSYHYSVLGALLLLVVVLPLKEGTFETLRQLHPNYVVTASCIYFYCQRL